MLSKHPLHPSRQRASQQSPTTNYMVTVNANAVLPVSDAITARTPKMEHIILAHDAIVMGMSTGAKNAGIGSVLCTGAMFTCFVMVSIRRASRLGICQ